MKIGLYQTHPAADVLELIEGEEFEKLVADIGANGQRDAITLIRVSPGTKPASFQILDGRNRYRAVLRLKKTPAFHYYDGKDPIGFVESKNVHRRHLTPSQRAMIAAKFAKLRDGVRQVGKFAEVPTQKQAATKLSVSERAVRSARVVLDKATPDVRKAVERGRIAVDAAAELALMPKATQQAIVKRFSAGESEIKSGHVRALVRQEKRRDVATRINASAMPMPIGPYRVIVSDPPWKFANSDGHAGSRGHTPYPPMELDAICALGRQVTPLAHDAGCILWLWTTNAHLVDGSASAVVKAWGFEAVSLLTWKKNKMGMGDMLRGETEHCIYAVRGKPATMPGTDTTWFEADVREHSRKPEKFYELVERRCPGAKLEMFCQTPREGWARWGAESEKYEAA